MRFLKTFLILGLCFFTFYFAAFLYFKHHYPADKISSLAQLYLSEQLGKPVQVEKGSFNVFKGFQVENIHILKDFTSEQKLVTVSRIELKYILKSLLKKKWEISQIVIYKPIFFLTDLDFQPAEKDTIQIREFEPIDWKLSLQNIVFEDATVQYKSDQERTSWKISLDKLSLNINDLFVPKIDFENLWQNISYDLTIQVNQGKLRFDLYSPDLFQLDSMKFSRINLKTVCDFVLESEKNGDSLYKYSTDSIKTYIDLLLSKNNCSVSWKNDEENITKINLPPLQLNLAGFTFSDFKKVKADLCVSLKNWFYAQTVGEFENFNHPKFSIFSDSISVAVDSSFQDVKSFSFLNELFKTVPDIKGILYVDSLKIAGERSKDFWEVEYQFRNGFESFEVDFKNGMKIQNLSGITYYDGLFKNSTFKHGRLIAQFSADSLILAEKINDPFISSPGTLEIKSILTQNFVPESFFVKTKFTEIFDGNFVATADLSIQDVFSIKEIDLHHIKGTVKLDANKMNLEKFAGNSISGYSDLSLNVINNYGFSSTILGKFTTTDLSAEFDTTEGFEMLPDVFLQINGELSSTPGFTEIKFENTEFIFNDLTNCKIDASYFPVLGESKIYLEDWFIDLPVLQDYFPAYLRDEMVSSIWEGGALINCEMSTWQGENSKIYSQIIGDLNISNEIFDNPYWYIRLDSLNLYGIFAGSLDELQLDLEGKMKEFKIIDSTPNYFDTEIFSFLSIENWNDIYIQSFSVSQPKLDVFLNAEGSIQNLSEQPVYFFSGGVKIENDSAIQIILGSEIVGEVSSQLSIFSEKENPNILQIKGWIDLDTLDFLMDEGIQLYSLKGRLPVDQLYDMESGYLIPVEQTQQQSLRTDLFEVYTNYYRNENTPYSILVADSLIYETYKAENIEMFFENEKGSFFIPKLFMTLYDGSLLMSSSINLNTGAWNDISYNLQGQLSRVNSSILPGIGRQDEEESRIGISFFVQGKGLDPAKKIELEGELNVTEIGSFATENLLNSIDPAKTDPSIRSVRRMIGLGYKPQSISFLMQHENFYPTISFRQPWYSPVRIAGGEISISRLPIKFLLDLMATSVGSVED